MREFRQKVYEGFIKRKLRVYAKGTRGSSDIRNLNGNLRELRNKGKFRQKEYEGIQAKRL